MAVYQVERYYIFMPTKEATNTQLNEINDYLESKYISDFEHQDGNIVIYGFESESAAENCESEINEILKR